MKLYYALETRKNGFSLYFRNDYNKVLSDIHRHRGLKHFQPELDPPPKIGDWECSETPLHGLKLRAIGSCKELDLHFVAYKEKEDYQEYEIDSSGIFFRNYYDVCYDDFFVLAVEPFYGDTEIKRLLFINDKEAFLFGEPVSKDHKFYRGFVKSGNSRHFWAVFSTENGLVLHTGPDKKQLSKPQCLADFGIIKKSISNVIYTGWFGQFNVISTLSRGGCVEIYLSGRSNNWRYEKRIQATIKDKREREFAAIVTGSTLNILTAKALRYAMSKRLRRREAPPSEFNKFKIFD